VSTRHRAAAAILLQRESRFHSSAATSSPLAPTTKQIPSPALGVPGWPDLRRRTLLSAAQPEQPLPSSARLDHRAR
jgi:hypothetical protein